MKKLVQEGYAVDIALKRNFVHNKLVVASVAAVVADVDEVAFEEVCRPLIYISLKAVK